MLNIPLYFAEKDREIEKLNRSGKIDELKMVLSLSREWQTEPLSVGRYFDI